jgi:hypothetical protein
VLQRFQQYSRKDIHGLFDQHSDFTPGSGTWGLQGIVRVPNRLRDYVFLVTFDTDLGHHAFDESVSQSGILTWQSQPKQKLNSRAIQDFITHDSARNNIYLFLRTSKKHNYSYLGKLAYLSHDDRREQPVYFKWQIVDWDFEEAQINNMGLRLVTDDSQVQPIGQKRDFLILDEKPSRSEGGDYNRSFTGRKIDFASNERNNKKLGELGELLVKRYEEDNLIKVGRNDLSQLIEHTSQIIGDGTGYDLISYTGDGIKKYIEVKTTAGGKGTPFYLSAQELAYATLNKEKYYIYRVYNYNRDFNTGELFILTYYDIIEIKKEPVNYKLFPREI